MKKEFALISIILLIVAITGCVEEETKKKAADFSLSDIYNSNFTLSTYHGKVVLINFMATWCEPCKDEMPVLVTAYEKHGNDLIMISIDFDTTESQEDLQEFKEKYNADWIFAFNNVSEDVADKYDILGIPTTFIIDIEGYISYTYYGPVKEKELLGEIEKAKR